MHLLEDALELLLIRHAHQAVREHSRAFVEPYSRILDGFLVQVGVRVQKALEDVADILEVELVVELGRRREEGGGLQDAVHERVDRGVHNRLAQLLHRRRERLQVLLQDRRVDALDDLGAGREASDDREAALKPRIDHERARLGVHASGEVDIDQVPLLLQRIPIVDLPVRHHLCDQHDGGLRVVCVHVRHVQVVDKVHALFVPRGPVCPTGALV
mmetsp:Transcript_4516/g.13038  ORF Transcript_4516/g.13038 Transcript_4516/m.13038 type:complete len:215 (-) Transcript_4516:7672-8316(-)